MPDVLDACNLCKKVKQSLASVAGQNYPLLQRQETGMLDAVLSSMNTANVEKVQVDARDGKWKEVILRYWQASTRADVTSQVQSVCNPGKKMKPKEEKKDVSKHTSTYSFEFTDEDFRYYCESRDVVIAQRVMALMNPVLQDINSRLIADYNSKYGKFLGGTGGTGQPLVTIPLIAQSSGNPDRADPKGEHLILEEFRKLSIKGKPILVGAGLLSQYMDLVSIGADNAYGQDITKLGKRVSWFWDPEVGIVTSEANAIVAMAPGAYHLLTFNKNKGEFRYADATRQKTTIVDPVTGLELDFELKRIDCDDDEGNMSWRMLVRVWWDTFLIPADVYETTDPRYGTNNLFMFEGDYTP